MNDKSIIFFEMKKIALISLMAWIITSVFFFGANALEITRYVKSGGTGKGTSWADACGSINQALSDIKTAGNGTVYIGPGNYTESVSIPYGSKKVNVLGGFSENDMENPKADQVFLTEGKYDIRKTVTAAIEVGWNCEDIQISGINIVKGTTGIVMRGANITVENCVISGCNTGITSDGAGNKSLRIRSCRVFNCNGAGMNLTNANIMSSTISENRMGLYLSGCYVYGCVIKDNVHPLATGGIRGDAGGIRMSQTHLIRCYISNNKCEGNGGGVFVSGSGYHSFIFQCIIVNNTALDGGGIYADEQVFIESSTIINNKAARLGGGICIGRGGWDNGSAMIGSILWNNMANNVAQQFGIYNNKKFNMTHSAIQGGGILPETDAQNGIIDVSPQNVDASKPCVAFKNVVSFSGSASTPEQTKQIHAQNVSLTAQSACIDRGGDFSELKIPSIGGTFKTLSAERDKDYKRNPRTDGKYDLGVWEYQKE